MDNTLKLRKMVRQKRAVRVRRHVRGTAEKPRLTVIRSNRHLAAQIIDDDRGITLVAANTQMKKFRTQKLSATKGAARLIGTELAELAKEKKITTVVFDRGFYKYHGVIAELASAAREGGLQF